MNNFWTDKAKNEKIQFVLDNFDFSKVRKTMKALNWTWGNSIPERDELIKTAKELLEDLNNQKLEMSTGGFRAELIDDIYRLTFCVDDMDSTFYKNDDF